MKEIAYAFYSTATLIYTSHWCLLFFAFKTGDFKLGGMVCLQKVCLQLSLMAYFFNYAIDNWIDGSTGITLSIGLDNYWVP